MSDGFAQQLLAANTAATSRDYKAFRTLYLMIGGTGMKIGMRLRKRVLAAHGVAQLPFQEFLWLDTDAGDLASQTIDDTREMARRLAMTSDDVVDLGLPFARVQAMRSNPQNFPWLAEWLDFELLDDLGHSARAEAGAAQIRALGRLAFEANFQGFRSRLLSKYERLLRPSLGDECRKYGYDVDDSTLEVVVLCSLAGGTGSGAFLQAARAVRELTRGSSVNTTAYLMLPGIYRELLKGPQMWEDVQANAYAALSELNALTALSQAELRSPPLWIDDFRVEQPIGDPFNQIYLVDARNDVMTLDAPREQDAYTMVADALFFDFEQSAFGTAKRSHRCNVGPHLANTTLLTVPVEDGTRRPEGLGGAPGRKPQYVFRFPNAFGAFGLARVPFERNRLTRAGGAWLARRMFALLVEPPAGKLPWKEVLDKVVRPRTAAAGLTPEAVVDALLAGPDGAPYPQAHGEQVRQALDALAAEAAQRFTAPGVAATEKLDRLNAAKDYGRDLRARANEIVGDARARVAALLDDKGPRSAWGEHLRGILDAQNATFTRYRDALRQFVVTLLAQPDNHGLDVAEQACGILRDELGQAAEEALPGAPTLDVPLLDLDPGAEVARAAELRGEAEALWLPIYRQMAQGWFGRRNTQLLAQAGHECADRARAFLDDLAERFRGWCEAAYRRVALERCRNLFSELAGAIGERTEIEGDDGERVVRTTGLRTELRLFREACEHGRQWFTGLEQSYANVKRSRRDAADLTPFDDLPTGVPKALAGGAIDAPPLPELLADAWRRFFTEAKLLPAGEGDPFELGLTTLMGRAVERQTSLQAWKAVEAALEDWAVERLGKARYLADQDAVRLLGAQGDAHALDQLGQAGRGAQPWLTFDRAHGQPRGLQPLALVGTPHVGSPLVDRWTRQQSGALAGATQIQNDSGSVVLYAERMAFPLFFVSALDELEKGYRAVAGRGTFEILRRHTLADYLDLPVIRPPRDPEQAAAWFKTDRLALEAALLNVFEVGPRGRVHYTFYEAASHVRNTFQVPGTLSAIAAKLRDDRLLLGAVRKAVEDRTLRVFADEEAALHAVKLALWTQNFAFPRKPGHTYLAHELAASVARQWREAAEQRQQIPWSRQIEKVEALPAPDAFGVTSPVRARALARGVGSLLAMPPRFLSEDRAALRRVF